MGITAQQRLERRRYVGSSDAPAIVGVDPFRTATDVYWSKVTDLAQVEKASFELGNRLEGAIIDWAGDQLHMPIERDVRVVALDGVRAANLDGRVLGRAWGIEAKYSSQPEKWGEPGTDDIPPRVSVQCQHQMAVADLELVWVPVLLSNVYSGLEFRMYQVERDDRIIEELTKQELEFWHSYVVPRIPPSGDTVPPMEVLQRMVRTEEMVDLDVAAEDVLRRWDEARAVVREAEAAADAAKRDVLALLGDAEGGRLPNGSVVTFREQRRAGVNIPALRAAYPDVWAEFATESRFRVLRRLMARKTLS